MAKASIQARFDRWNEFCVGMKNTQLLEAADLLWELTGTEVQGIPCKEMLAVEDQHLARSAEEIKQLLDDFEAKELDLDEMLAGNTAKPKGSVFLIATPEAARFVLRIYELSEEPSSLWRTATWGNPKGPRLI